MTAGRWGAIPVLLLGLLACSGDEGSAPTTTSSTTTSTIPTPTLTGDGTPFCDAMLGVGQIAGAEGASPEEVLASTDELAARLDEAQVNTPEDAPADFDALLDDYRVAIDAIRDANGDVNAAFAALERAQPDVVARLSSSTSHEEAFTFLIERCGAAP